MHKVIFIIIFLLSSCGYKPLYSTKDLNKLTFKTIELKGNKNISRRISSSISLKEDNEKFSYEKITLTNEKKIIETSKDSKGKADSFKMIINVQITMNNKNLVKEKNFFEEFSYKNLDNKFDLSEYELNIENNLVDKIIEEIIIYLNL